MRIKTLTFSNLRGFSGEHSIRFPRSGPTILVGINGAGKSTVLDATAFLLEQLADFFLTNPPQKKKSIQFNHDDIFLGENIFSIKGLFFYREKSLQINRFLGIQQDWKVEEPAPGIKGEALDLLLASFKGKSEYPLPILIHYPTHRTISGEGIRSSILQNNGHQRQNAYLQAFQAEVNSDIMVKWYIEQLNIQNAEKVQRKDLDFELPTVKAISRGLNRFLSCLEDSRLKNVDIGVSRFTSNQVLMVSKGEKSLEFGQLSSGEKNLIGMCLDIIYRMSVANPGIEDPLQSPGIVLIDELELHLHPKWQESALQAFTSVFPNIQFIVATHSPLVINHIRHEQLILLDNFRIIQGEDLAETYGRDTNSILNYFMGANERPKEIKQRVEAIEKILDVEKPDLKKARQMLEKLKAQIAPNDLKITELETLITLEENNDLD